MYSLPSTEAEENRKQILQQRQDQRERWEAQKLVLRGQQAGERQRRQEPESLHAERRSRAEARARNFTRQAIGLIYERTLQRYLSEEGNSEQNPVAPQNRPAIPAHSNDSPNPSSHFATDAANPAIAVHGSHYSDQQRANQPGVSTQQEAFPAGKVT